MKKLLSSKEIKWEDVVATLLALFALIFLFLRNVKLEDLTLQDEAVSVGYLATAYGTDVTQETDEAPMTGSLLYIDGGKSRVVGLKNGKADFIVNAGGKNFYQAEDLCVDESDGSFYVSSVDWDGSGYLLASERILHYDANGKLLDQAYIEEYEPKDEINRHRIFDLRFESGALSFIRADDKGITLCAIRDDLLITIASYPYPDAWIYFQNFAHTRNGAIYGVQKQGQIIRFAGSGQKTVYQSPEGSSEVLFDVDVDEDGRVYFVDIYGGRICSVMSRGHSREVIGPADVLGEDNGGNGSVVSNIYANDATLATIYNDQVVLFNTNGKIALCESVFPKGPSFYLYFGTSLVAVLMVFFGALYLVLRLYFYFRLNQIRLSGMVISEIFFVVFTLALSFSIIYGVTEPFGYNYLSTITGNLKDMAIIGANRFDPDWLRGIKTAADFKNEDYNAMTSLMHAITTDKHDVTSRYGAEVDIIDPDGRGYSLSFTDDSIGTYYPLDAYTYEEIQKIYETGEASESEPTISAGGTFLFGRAPIVDENGKVVAVFAVAQDNYKVMEMFQSIISGVLISILLAVIAVIFLLNEGFVLLPEIREAKHGNVKATIGGHPVPLSVLRIMTFTVAFVLNMTSSFLSVYTSSFWSESLGIPQSLAGAIPLFANSILVAVSALFCPTLMNKLGFQKLTILGLLLAGCGDCLAGFSKAYAPIVMALLLNGAGFGILMNTISITIGMVDQDDRRQKGFAGYNAGFVAGINCGMIAGSFIAGVLEYNQVFFVTTALWVSQILLFAAAGKGIHTKKGDVWAEDRAELEKHGFPILGLLYVLIVAIPYSIIGSFQYYYIPILSDSLGYNEKYTSLLMLIFAICGILLGDRLTGIMWHRLKDKAVFSAYSLALIAWLIISSTNDLRIVAMAMVVLGISFAFGLNVIVETFLNQWFMKHIKEDTAMSVYNFATGIGQSFSSIVCGIILAAGMFYGMAAFACVCAALLVLALILFRQKGKLS
ncbi:MAG: MFS transporter [Lachnospiraceae bacterium]|nr:MFS transporter [Lachnospiraceae bacterium]